jgi:uncharacterized protein YebE (UPF0316 family)
MIDVVLIAALILILRIGQDTLFLAKIDAFNRGNRYYSGAINFFEAMYGITVIKIILDLMQKDIYYIFIYGFGSILGGLVSGYIKNHLDKRLIGQRQYFARISLENDIDRSNLIQTLAQEQYDFTVSTKEYVSGKFKILIEGSIENRARMLHLKDILRGRQGKHVTILRADEVYWLK